MDQGGRTWQPFVGSKNGNENFPQARIYNFHSQNHFLIRILQFYSIIFLLGLYFGGEGVGNYV